MGWTRRDASTEGEVGELLVWAALEAQSQGLLHVFLPIWDEGLDALVHRRPDGAFLPVQVKVRQPQPSGSLHLVVPSSALSAPDALLIAAPLSGGRLGEWALVITEAEFAAIGSSEVDPARPPWTSHVVATAGLADRLGASRATVAPLPRPSRPGPGWLGRLGETEVVRRLAEAANLQLFRAAPDDELVEIAARDATTGRVTGFQVKTVSLDSAHRDATVMIRRATFTAAPATRLVVLAWHRDRQAFDPECLCIPTAQVASVARVAGDHLRFDYHPRSPAPSRLDPYRRPLSALALP